MGKQGKGADDLIKYIAAENEAFEKAGIQTGEVEFKCPICGGKAKGNRYYHGGRIHGLGSQCTRCKIWHT